MVTTGVRPLEENLVLDLRMNEGAGSIVRDVSSSRAHGTITGASWTTGKYGQGLSFNGATDFVDVSNSNALLNGLKIGTLVFWAKTTGQLATYRHYAGWRAGAESFFVLQRSNSDTMEIRCRTVSGYKDLTPSFSGYYGDFVQIAVVRDGISMTAYFNADEVATRADLFDEAWGVSSNFFLGRHPTVAQYYYDGILDDCKFYNIALTEDEIKLLYAQRGRI
jgi:hypothetical protein